MHVQECTGQGFGATSIASVDLNISTLGGAGLTKAGERGLGLPPSLCGGGLEFPASLHVPRARWIWCGGVMRNIRHLRCAYERSPVRGRGADLPACIFGTGRYAGRPANSEVTGLTAGITVYSAQRQNTLCLQSCELFTCFHACTWYLCMRLHMPVWVGVCCVSVFFGECLGT